MGRDLGRDFRLKGMLMLKRFLKEETGQDLIEYALLAGFISLAAIAGITVLGTSLDEFYDKIAQKVTDAPDGGAPVPAP